MDLAWCVHGLENRQSARERTSALEVSPRGWAHFPGCPHKGDDPEKARWGRIEEPDAWQVLGNGVRITTADQIGRELVAHHRCETCLAHGPW